MAHHLDNHIYDGDTRTLVARAALRGIPVGVVRKGRLHIVRNLNELEEACS